MCVSTLCAWLELQSNGQALRKCVAYLEVVEVVGVLAVERAALLTIPVTYMYTQTNHKQSLMCEALVCAECIGSIY